MSERDEKKRKNEGREEQEKKERRYEKEGRGGGGGNVEKGPFKGYKPLTTISNITILTSKPPGMNF